MNQSKNGLDMQMSLDALETSLVDERIDIFYLVTADSDFGPLARALRRHGRVVIGVGWREKTNDIFRQHCDVFVDYDDLPGEAVQAEPEPAVAPSERRTRPTRPERPERPIRSAAPTSHEPRGLFMHDPRYDAEAAGETDPSAVPFVSEPRPMQRASRPPRRPLPQTRDLTELNAGIAALVEEQGPEARLNPSQFQRAIRRIDPGFTPMAFGYGSMPEFVEAHPLLGRGEVNGGPHVIVLPNAATLAAALTEPTVPDGNRCAATSLADDAEADHGLSCDDRLEEGETLMPLALGDDGLARAGDRDSGDCGNGSDGPGSGHDDAMATASPGLKSPSDSPRNGAPSDLESRDLDSSDREPGDDEDGEDDHAAPPPGSLHGDDPRHEGEVAFSAAGQPSSAAEPIEHRHAGWWQRR